MNKDMDISNSCDKITESDYKNIIYGLASPYEKIHERDNILHYIHDADNLSNSEVVEFESYKELFEDGVFYERLKQDLKLLSYNEIENWITSPVLNELSNQDNDIDCIIKKQRREELDLDNDGIVDRIDIDDTRNAVQDVKDQSIVKHHTSKESSRSTHQLKR